MRPIAAKPPPAGTTGTGAALVLALVLPGAGVEAETTHRVTVQPVQVRDDASGKIGNPGGELYEAAADKIWAQGGIDIHFLPLASIDRPEFIDLDDQAEFDDLMQNADDHGGADPDGTVINVFFVATIFDNNYGLGRRGLNGVAVANKVFAQGRIDTIAHEIGHNLSPFISHSSTASNLMADGATRTVPSGLGDIAPDGANLDQLTSAQITRAMAGRFVLEFTPEPASLSSVTPESTFPGRRIDLVIRGEATDFTGGAGTASVRLLNGGGGASISSQAIVPASATELTATFDLPASAALGSWDLEVVTAADGTLTAPGLFTLADPDDDADGDGVDALHEFAFGGDPATRSLASPGGAPLWPRVGTVVTPEGRFLQISYRQLSPTPGSGASGTTGIDYQAFGVSYVVETIDGSAPTSWDGGVGRVTPVGDPVANGDGTQSVVVRALPALQPDETRFIRLLVR